MLKHELRRRSLRLLLAVLGVSVGLLTVSATAEAQAPVPVAVGRGGFAGVPPQGEGIALLVTTEAASGEALTLTLSDAGCLVETILVLRPPSPVPLTEGSGWTPFIAGAPAAANEGFLRTYPTIPANTPFFLRCRAAVQAAIDPANARYRIGNTVYTLVNGRSDVEAAPGSASRVVTQLTDRRSFGNIDGGTADAAVVLTYSGGGSGTFSYLAVQTGGTSGAGVGPTVLLGDRVTATGVQVAQGRVVVTYLTRRPAEAMALPPTLPVTKVYTLTDGVLVEVGSIVG
jgi:hypothetical protein